MCSKSSVKAMTRLGVLVILFCYIHISTSKCIKDVSPNSCKKYGICADGANYPTELARKLIAELKAQNVLFNVEEPPEDEVILNPRSFFQERDLCKTIIKSWQPIKALHESGRTKIILNDDVPRQVFNVGYCPESSETRDDVSTFCRTQTFLTGYEGRCIQKTRLKEMYYIEGNRTERGYFHVPTCCSCDYEKI